MLYFLKKQYTLEETLIYYHADDYGLGIRQSERILECHTNGVLNSVSILPNSSCLEAVLRLLPDEVARRIHLNLCEGPCCAKKEQIPLLADANGMLFRSFPMLLLLSFLHPKAVRHQVRTECLAQIKRVCAYLPKEYALRLDSHRHYHMIPAVFAGVYDAARASGRRTEYVRIPADPWRIWLRQPATLLRVKPVNLVKNLVLTMCKAWDMRMYRKWNPARRAVFFGMMYTGEMTYAHVRKMLPHYEAEAKRRGEDLELMFHPGGVTAEEESFALTSVHASFYTAKNRDREYRALQQLRCDFNGKVNWKT